jgi:DNA-binding NarL/FixJ family response regulator
MKILLIDDHTLFREGLRPILNLLADGVSELLEAGNFPDGLKLAEQRPDLDLVLLEIKSPDSNGMHSVKIFRKHCPHIPLVVLSSIEDCHVIKEALDAGADGYVCKCSSSSTLLSALSLVLAGSLYVPQQLLHPTMTTTDYENNNSNDRNLKSKKNGLTSRQMDVLRCIAEGLSNKEIGEAINLAEGTVKVHIAAAFQTLGVKKRIDAVQAAKRLGLIGMSHV